MTLHSPVIPPKARLHPWAAAQLTAQERYEQMLIEGMRFDGQDARLLHFEQTLCRDTGFRGVESEGIQLVDCRLVDCDLANARWSNGGLHRVTFQKCRMTGFIGTESLFEEVLFHDCMLDLALFRYAVLRHVRFKDCLLQEADLQGAKLTDVRFEGCSLAQVQLSQSRLRDVNIAGCAIDGLRIGMSEVAGLTVDPAQALALVQLFGVKIEWPA
uniref:Pentapeptide repeat protein n=1 Tax=Thermosporothrix sp. COM3 TaxID=2490863 RepID=A0A455SII7_9CHLR|nr:hypothetical protein KTC_07260 [Thermosporothrix sp. COM3]